MKVCIHYSDGQYGLYLPHHEEAATVEISSEEWALYQSHVEADRGWHQRIATLESSESYQAQIAEGWRKLEARQ